MKQFNLEEYLANPSKKIVTRDGREARIICIDKIDVCPIVALVKKLDGTEKSISYLKDGEALINSTSSVNDLFFASEKHKGWVNIYRDLKIDELYCRYIFPSEEEAKRNTTSDVIATVKIEWET